MVGGQPAPQLLNARERERLSIVQEAAWMPGMAWNGTENLAFVGIRSPYRLARSESK